MFLKFEDRLGLLLGMVLGSLGVMYRHCEFFGDVVSYVVDDDDEYQPSDSKSFF